MSQRKGGSKDLSKAKVNKNDEFYTQLVDIERELKHYREHFLGKTVFCNCDDPGYSNFFRYFVLNFHTLGLKKLIATHYSTTKPSYKIQVTKSDLEAVTIHLTNTNIFDDGEIFAYFGERLEGDGDFRNMESIELLKQSDIVVTNPPFSLFREYIAQLIEYGRNFLIIGNINCITYKEIFRLIKNNSVWLGMNMGRGISGFLVPDHYELYGTEARMDENGRRIVATNNCLWLTNLDNHKRHENILLYKTYSPEEYPKYDNYDAINVDKTKNIPIDYTGMMGVPITFLDKYNPEQFEIIGMDQVLVKELTGKTSRFSISGKTLYARIIIKNKTLS